MHRVGQPWFHRVCWLVLLVLIGGLFVGSSASAHAGPVVGKRTPTAPVPPDAVTIEAAPDGGAVIGTTVTFTAKILSNQYYVCHPPDTPTACGTVTFQFTGATTMASPKVAITEYDGDPMYGDGNGIASYQIANLAAGVTHVVAQYNDDGRLQPASSTAIDYTISTGTTASSTGILAASGGSSSASMLSVIAGDSVTFTAMVADGSGALNPPTPTGSVQFLDGITPLAAASALDGSGVATLMTAALAPGSHTVTAQYAGDATYAPSASAAVTVLVMAAPLTNSGSVTPPRIASGFGLSVDVTITGTNTAVGAVSVDLTAIGLGPTALTKRADTVWHTTVTVPNSAPVGGPYTLPVTLTDTANNLTPGTPLGVTIIRQARGISITPGDGSMIAHTTKTFSLSATYTNGQTATVVTGVVWRTGNANIASVDSAGHVTAGASGATTLTATYDGLTITIPLSILAGGPPVVPPVTASQATPAPLPSSHPSGAVISHPNGAQTTGPTPNPAPPRH